MLKQVVGSPRPASLSRPCLPVGLVNFLPLSLSFCSPFFNLAISVAAPRYGYGHLFLVFPTRPLDSGHLSQLPRPRQGQSCLEALWAAPPDVSDLAVPGVYSKRCHFLHTHIHFHPLRFQEAVPGALTPSVYLKKEAL